MKTTQKLMCMASCVEFSDASSLLQLIVTCSLWPSIYFFTVLENDKVLDGH